VRIDLICDDDDDGELRAFDASDNLLDTSAITCDGRTSNASGTAVINRDAKDIAYVMAGGNGGEALLLDNLQYNNFSPTCDVQLRKSSYSVGETVRAKIFRLSNLSLEPVSIRVLTWFSAPGEAFHRVWPLRKGSTITLKPGAELDLGPLRLRKVPVKFPLGPVDVICRLVDKVTGGHYDTNVSQFEIQ
jgi:hypothetical protein